VATVAKQLAGAIFGAGQNRYRLADRSDTTTGQERLRRQYKSYNNFYTLNSSRR